MEQADQPISEHYRRGVWPCGGPALPMARRRGESTRAPMAILSHRCWPTTNGTWAEEQAIFASSTSSQSNTELWSRRTLLTWTAHSQTAGTNSRCLMEFNNWEDLACSAMADVQIESVPRMVAKLTTSHPLKALGEGPFDGHRSGRCWINRRIGMLADANFFACSADVHMWSAASRFPCSKGGSRTLPGDCWKAL
jgi:hypothetical protein